VIKLYGGGRSRASIIQWYLEELAVPYEFVLLDMLANEHLQPDFLAINPFGKVPAIVDDGFKLWESGAILLYLAEKYDNWTTSNQVAELAQWILFANATLGPGLLVESTRDREMPRLLTPINEMLSHASFFHGDQFSVIDVAVGSYLNYANTLLKLDLSPYPAIVNYIQQITARPAFLKSIGNR
jgi:glutathione S-transferase